MEGGRLLGRQVVEPIGSDHKGQLLIFEVRIGDILVFATDGFFDNVSLVGKCGKLGAVGVILEPWMSVVFQFMRKKMSFSTVWG